MRDRIRLVDMGHLSARLGANCQRQTAYLLLAEMSRAPINPCERSKRDDRQEGRARGAMTRGCCACQTIPARRNLLSISRTVQFPTFFGTHWMVACCRP